MPVRTVLLTDDPELIRALQGSFLNRKDFRVLTTAAGEAFERARSERPDLVLLVAEKKEPAVWEACRRMKGEEALQEIPIIIIAPDSDHQKYLDAGADGVLSHPPSRKHLLERVRTLLAGSLRATRRRSARLRVTYFHGDDERLGYSKDVAVEGLFLRTRESFAVGDALQVIFELPLGDRPVIRAEGDVVRQIKPDQDSPWIPGIGLRFRRLSARDRRELERYIGEGS